MINESNKTGYPHIDKPWMKWYQNNDININNPKMNLNKYVKSKVEGINQNKSIAQTYFGNKISYSDFFKKVDSASKVFDQMRIKVKDRIMYFVPALPETTQMWLGAAQMGITSDFVDPRPDGIDMDACAKKVLNTIIKEKAQYIVAFDIFYLNLLKPIENELKELGIEEIILLSGTDSMNLSGKLDYLNDGINYQKFANDRDLDNYIVSLLTKKSEEYSPEIKNVIDQLEKNVLSYNKKIELLESINDSNINKKEIIYLVNAYKKTQLQSAKVVLNKIKEMQETGKKLDAAIKTSPLKIYKYKDLVKECENSKFITNEDVDLMTYIAHTSGTSSEPKAIPATTKNLIAAIEDLFKGDVNFKPNQTILQFFAPYAPIGGADSFLLNLASGSNSIIIPEIVFSDFWYIVDKNKANVLLMPPTLLTNLFKNKHMNGKDLSYIERVLYGGGGIKEKDEKAANQILKAGGSQAQVEVGHGQSEFMGCGAYGQKNYKKYESIGIPLPDTIYAIVDPDEDEMIPIKFNDKDEFIEGELVVSNGALTSGILDERIITPHYTMDGKTYIKTNDLVRMDKDGIFYHEARKDNVFTRFDGYKINPYGIEKAIEENNNVLSCNIVAYYDKEKGGNMPIAHLVLKEELNNEELYQLIHDIVYKQIMSNADLNSRIIPSLFKIRKELPSTKNGKVAFRVLEKEVLDGSEIKVSIQETSSSVGKIKIELPIEKNNNVRILK